MIGIPFLTLYNTYAAVLRGIGDSKAPLYSVLVSTIINIILDIIFVMVFRWSVKGAAIATVISQIVMALYIVSYASKRYEDLRFNLGITKINRSVLTSGLALSLPLAIQSTLGAGGNLILQSFMNSFGTTTVAAITTAYRIDSVIMLPIINLGIGVATITSQNFGAGKFIRMRKSLAAGTALMSVVSLSLTALVLLFSARLIKLFGVSDEGAGIGAQFFKILGYYYIIFGFATVFRGYGLRPFLGLHKDKEMYSNKGMKKAVELYIEYNKSASKVVRELGYTTRKTFKRWYKEYYETRKLHKKHQHCYL